jgi:hypothetical protein
MTVLAGVLLVLGLAAVPAVLAKNGGSGNGHGDCQGVHNGGNPNNNGNQGNHNGYTCPPNSASGATGASGNNGPNNGTNAANGPGGNGTGTSGTLGTGTTGGCPTVFSARIRLHHVRQLHIVKATVTVNGRRVKTLRGRRAVRKAFTIRGLPPSRVVVRIRGLEQSGRHHRGTRIINQCPRTKRRHRPLRGRV